MMASKAEGVADHAGGGFIAQNPRHSFKGDGLFRRFNIGFDGHKAALTGLAHQRAEQDQQVLVIVPPPFRAAKRLGKAAERLACHAQGITDQDRANCRAADQRHLERERMHGAAAARQKEAAENEDKDKYEAGKLRQGRAFRGRNDPYLRRRVLTLRFISCGGPLRACGG